MWVDFKTLSFLKIGSMVKKLFVIEKLHMRHFLHRSFGGNGQLFLIFIYFIDLCNINHL